MSITDRIRLDYEESMRQAAKLDRLADRLRSRTVQGIDAAAENMVIAWQSETSEACRSKERILREQIFESAGKLAATAEVIRRVARNTYAAEMAAVAIARQRIYH